MPKDYSSLSMKQWKKIDPPLLPPRNVEVHAEIMAEAHHIMNMTCLYHLLVDGALVCIYRDGALLDHNQDIDFACYAEDIKPKMAELKYRFMNEGYDVRAFKDNTRLNAYKNGEAVSIQGYVKKGKFRYLKNKKIPDRYFVSSEELLFKGITYPVPMIEKYLSWKYSNWKKPYTGDTKNKCYLNKKRLVG